MNYVDKELKRYEGESNMKIMLTKKEFDELFDYLNYLDADPCKTNNCNDEPYCAGCSKRIKWEYKLKTYPNKDSIEVILGHKHIANYIQAVNEEKRISDELKKLKEKRNTLINEITEYSKQFEVRDENNAVIAFPHFE